MMFRGMLVARIQAEMPVDEQATWHWRSNLPRRKVISK
jgi:hypothetical protein